MAVSKIKMSNARRALIEAGMSRTVARSALRFLDLGKPIGPQIAALVEEDPELFGLDADGNEIPDEDAEDTPMTAAQAKAARLRGGHRLRTAPGEGSTSAERLAAALMHDERPRTSAAPATARRAADVLTRGVGRSADR